MRIFRICESCTGTGIQYIPYGNTVKRIKCLECNGSGETNEDISHAICEICTEEPAVTEIECGNEQEDWETVKVCAKCYTNETGEEWDYNE